jgi:hypothetical protein
MSLKLLRETVPDPFSIAERLDALRRERRLLKRLWGVAVEVHRSADKGDEVVSCDEGANDDG